MIPVLAFAVLCGLLAQNTQGFDANSQAVVTVSEETFQRLISERMNSQEFRGRLQKLPLQSLVQREVQQKGKIGIFGGIPIIGGLVDNVLGSILGINIRNVQLLKLDIRFDKTAGLILLTIPADLEVELNLPLNLGRVLYLKLYLDIQVGVHGYRDQWGYWRLAVGNCQNNPGHLRVTLLNNEAPIIQAVNDLLRTVTNVFEKTLPHLLQKELCPLVNGVIASVLDILQGSFSSNIHGGTIQLSPVYSSVQSDGLQLYYHGNTRAQGGKNYMIPPNSKPLPPAPLNGSPMNIVLSDHIVTSILSALLTPKAININRQQEVAAFNNDLAAVLGPQGVTISALQVSYGSPAVSTEDGRTQVQQNIEVRAFGKHPGGPHQLLFSIGDTMTLRADVSAKNGNLRTTLGLEGTNNSHLIRSSIGKFDVQRLRATIYRMLSEFVISHQNSQLSQGFTLPLVKEVGLGASDLKVVSGQNMLLVTASSSQSYTMAHH